MLHKTVDERRNEIQLSENMAGAAGANSQRMRLLLDRKLESNQDGPRSDVSDDASCPPSIVFSMRSILSTALTERFARNFRRLLKLFSANLKEEAQDSFDMQLANIVLSKAGFVANTIRDKNQGHIRWPSCFVPNRYVRETDSGRGKAQASRPLKY